MTFREFCVLTGSLAATRSRLNKISLTSDFLRRLSPPEVPSAVAFLTARPLPAADPRVLDVRWATLSDLLDTLDAAPSTAALTLLDVASRLGAIAEISGPGSKRRRLNELSALYRLATAEERRAVTGILLGELRIGLHDGLIQDAIADAASVAPERVRRAALFLSDLSEVARIALTEGPTALEQVGPRLFVPLLPMLAEVSDGFGDVFEAHGVRTALEFKYDGARLQIHKRGDTVRIWSRRLTEVTDSLPDIVALARGSLHGDAMVLDGEVVAVDAGGRPLPFQDLMRRWRRVHDIEATAREIPLVLYLFDCLMLDDRSLIDDLYEHRWRALEGVTRGAHLARRMVAEDATSAHAFLAEALAAGHEGVMAKALDSTYTPGSRGKRWFKVKPAETIDCVIAAADWGSGRRRGWLSNYHLTVADGAGGFVPVGKTFKGLTDEEFRDMTNRLRSLMLRDDGSTVTVRPQVVVEVTYNEIQKSPQYSSGFALRFARITRIRDDKGPQETTELSQLQTLYEKQFSTKGRRASEL